MTSKFPFQRCQIVIADDNSRFEIEGDAPAWEEAEKQAKSAAKSGKSNPVVSVKSGKQKRKAGPTAAEIYEEEMGEKSRKKVKKGKRAA